MRAQRRNLAIGLLLAASACSPLRRSGREPATIVFHNQSTDLVDVYAVREEGNQVRLGSVGPGRTQSLAVSPTALGGTGAVNIVARILARSRAPSTGTITLREGERLEITLPPAQNILMVLPGASP